LDGTFKLNSLLPQKAIIKADEKVLSCTVASIIAKVTRDRLMLRYAKKYPHYQFERHKGYGTVRHCQMLREHGPCPIHRRSFRPVRNIKSLVI
jgi:ribonuclease HII